MSANATNFAWYDSLGKIHEMTRDYEGKVIVLTFFSTWSDLAVQQFPDLIKLHHELVDSNVIFMASSMKEGVQGSKLVMMLDTFVRAHNIDFQVLAGSLDFSWTYGGVSRVPTTFIVSHRGHVTATLEGKQTIAELKKEIWRARNK